MSKFSDKDGLAHLWERIQELVATCGGGNYESETIEFIQPEGGKYLYADTIVVSGHLGITLAEGESGTVTVGLSTKPHADAVAVALQGIRSLYNGASVGKIQSISYDAENRNYLIHYEGAVTLQQNDLSIDVVEFRLGNAYTSSFCALKGSCDSGGGGDIAV